MNDFLRDDAWQKKMRDAILAQNFYGKYATEGRYVFIDKGRLSKTLQRRYAVDTVVQGRQGNAVCIEEKIVRWPAHNKPYEFFCLETNSCTKPGHESDGWMVYGQADYLLYCFANADETALVCYLIDFPLLQDWFRAHQDGLRIFQMQGTLNETRGRLAPIIDVCQAVPVKTWRIEAQKKGLDKERSGV